MQNKWWAHFQYWAYLLVMHNDYAICRIPTAEATNCWVNAMYATAIVHNTLRVIFFMQVPPGIASFSFNNERHFCNDWSRCWQAYCDDIVSLASHYWKNILCHAKAIKKKENCHMVSYLNHLYALFSGKEEKQTMNI